MCHGSGVKSVAAKGRTPALPLAPLLDYLPEQGGRTIFLLVRTRATGCVRRKICRRFQRRIRSSCLGMISVSRSSNGMTRVELIDATVARAICPPIPPASSFNMEARSTAGSARRNAQSSSSSARVLSQLASLGSVKATCSIFCNNEGDASCLRKSVRSLVGPDRQSRSHE